jgi:hypothetical protein
MTDKLKNIIKNSGNNLHFKTMKILENLGWDVDISCYYLDDTTSKPREIDIIAKKKIYLSQRPSFPKPEDFYVFLFIECKHFSDDIAFWMHKSDHKNELPFGMGIGNQLIPQNHHYFVDNVGKLYSTEGKESDVFDAITQPIKALVSFTNGPSNTNGLYYPICIYEGIPDFYLIKNDSDLSSLDNLEKTDNLLIELNYSWKKDKISMTTQMQRYFAVDLTNFKNIEKLIKIIDNETEQVRGNLCDFINKRFH